MKSKLICQLIRVLSLGCFNTHSLLFCVLPFFVLAKANCHPIPAPPILFPSPRLTFLDLDLPECPCSFRPTPYLKKKKSAFPPTLLPKSQQFSTHRAMVPCNVHLWLWDSLKILRERCLAAKRLAVNVKWRSGIRGLRGWDLVDGGLLAQGTVSTDSCAIQAVVHSFPFLSHFPPCLLANSGPSIMCTHFALGTLLPGLVNIWKNPGSVFRGLGV